MVDQNELLKLQLQAADNKNRIIKYKHEMEISERQTVILENQQETLDKQQETLAQQTKFTGLMTIATIMLAIFAALSVILTTTIILNEIKPSSTFTMNVLIIFTVTTFLLWIMFVISIFYIPKKMNQKNR